MSEITLIGIDLAKTIFRINVLDGKGKRVMNKNIHRDNLVRFFAPLNECTVAMEACASSHYWGRTIESLGHTVKLIHPRYVAPYRLGDKNDANDAAAICAAAMRPDMRFVRLKSQRQSDVQAVHRMRSGLIGERTATINRVRALLAEDGISIRQGRRYVMGLLPGILSDTDNELSSIKRRALQGQYSHLLHLDEQVTELETMLSNLAAEEEDCHRLMQVPGFGLITATLLASELDNGSAFRNSRAFAAYLGLVPRQHSSGGKNILLGISKHGNRHLRTLLIHGARAVMRSINNGKDPLGPAVSDWVKALQERRGTNKAAVALAGKLARIAWKMLAKGADFSKVAQAA